MKELVGSHTLPLSGFCLFFVEMFIILWQPSKSCIVMVRKPSGEGSTHPRFLGKRNNKEERRNAI